MAKSLKQTMTPKPKKLVNHIIVCLDSSSSFQRHHDKAMESLKGFVQSVNQNMADMLNKISVYSFHSTVDLIISDVEANAPFPANKIRRPYGNTALLDCVGKAISDFENVKYPANEDHTFLLYVITDGEENCSRLFTRHQISTKIEGLDDSWTVAIMVPNALGVHYAKQAGFPAGNIDIWDASSDTGYETVEKSMNTVTQTYSSMRSSGVRSTNTLFTVNANNISRSDVKQELTKVDGKIFVAQKDYVIKEFVEKMTGKFVVGSAFYELKKKETIQANKKIVIVPVGGKDGVKYGGASARKMLGLPDHEVKVNPGDLAQWRIFVQSTSLNRKLPKGTSVFIQE